MSQHAVQAMTKGVALRPVDGRSALQDARPGDSSAVCIRALTKRYRNPWTLQISRGLEPLDLDVHRGEVFGYLGPNGVQTIATSILQRQA